jgi:tellurium resistance protein TerZ
MELQRNDPVYIYNPQQLTVGVAWDILDSKTVDLDASCFVFDAFGNVLDVVYYNQMSSRDGAVVHSGDEKTGERIFTSLFTL